MKQTGGHGQYAVCTIEIEPLPRGEGFVYDNKIFGGAIPSQFIPSIEKGIVKTMSDGVISGNPMVDIKVTLLDGKFHPVDSSDMAFQIAGSLALKEAVEAAGVVLLEPVVDLEVVVPDAYTGDIMGDLNSKRGKIGGMEQIGGREAAHPRGRAAGGGRALRHRPALHDGGSRRVLHDALPLRGAADAPGAEGHRRVPEGARGSAEEVVASDEVVEERQERAVELHGPAEVHDVVGAVDDDVLRVRGCRARSGRRSCACRAGRARRSSPASARRSRRADARPAGPAPPPALVHRELVDVVERDLADQPAGVVVRARAVPRSPAAGPPRAPGRRPSTASSIGAFDDSHQSSSSSSASKPPSPDATATSARRGPGCSSVKSIAIAPPMEHPTSVGQRHVEDVEQRAEVPHVRVRLPGQAAGPPVAADVVADHPERGIDEHRHLRVPGP